MEITIKPFEKTNFADFEEGNGIYIDDVSVTYCQSADCTEDSDEVQTLTISSRNNGMGRFINLKTENWSISNLDELKAVINDFQKRAEITEEEDGKDSE